MMAFKVNFSALTTQVHAHESSDLTVFVNANRVSLLLVCAF